MSLSLATSLTTYSKFQRYVLDSFSQVREKRPLWRPQAESLHFSFDEAIYICQPLKSQPDQLKVLLTVIVENDRFTDRLDLYLASSRRAFCKLCADKFLLDASVFESDLEHIISKIEENQKVSLSSSVLENNFEPIESTLNNPEILEEWVQDIQQTGFVGEPENLKIGLLTLLSQNLENPLKLIIQSSRGSGKSHLLKILCDITPTKGYKNPQAYIKCMDHIKAETKNLYQSLVIRMDESLEQTQLILKTQRQQAKHEATTHKQKIYHKWRLILKKIASNQFMIAIPYAHFLRFSPNLESRENQQKFITLIQVITLLKSKQRSQQNGSQEIYLMSTLEDYKIAYELFLTTTNCSSYQLSAQAQDFLSQFEYGLVTFSRRDIMKELNWSFNQANHVVNELLEQEILAEAPSKDDQTRHYRLLKTHMPNLKYEGMIHPRELELMIKDEKNK